MGDPVPAFTEREIRLINNCKNHAADDPAGLPGHNLIIIIAKLSDLLIGKELEEASETPERTELWDYLDGVWFYAAPLIPRMMKSKGKWHYSVPSHAKMGVAMTKEDAMACVEMILNPDEKG